MKLTNDILEKMIIKQMMVNEQTTPVPNPESAVLKNQEQLAKNIELQKVEKEDEKNKDVKEISNQKLKILKIKATELNSKMDNLPHDDLMSAIKVILSQVSAL